MKIKIFNEQDYQDVQDSVNVFLSKSDVNFKDLKLEKDEYGSMILVVIYS